MQRQRGPWSQQRIGNVKRAHQLANPWPKPKRKGAQQTLVGGVAFESERDCMICKAKALQKLEPTYRIPKRAHHVLCIQNTKTKGKGILSRQTMATQIEESWLKKLYETPLQQHEKGSAANLSKEASTERRFQQHGRRSLRITTTPN